VSRTAKKLFVLPAPAPQEAGEIVIRIARVLTRERDRFRVRWGRCEEMVDCDPSVDPALVESAIESGTRVVVEDGVIVGALATARAVPVGRDGTVSVSVKRFEVTAHEEALLKTPSAFLCIKGDEVEIFGRRLLYRARELARVLARAIQLN
jgi:hypothetical protein